GRDTQPADERSHAGRNEHPRQQTPGRHSVHSFRFVLKLPQHDSFNMPPEAMDPPFRGRVLSPGSGSRAYGWWTVPRPAGVLRACIDPERGGEKESPPGTSFPRGFALARPGGFEPPTSGFVVRAAASPGFTGVPETRMAVRFASLFQGKNHGVSPPARGRAATLCNMSLRPGPAARHVRGL